MSIPIEAVKTLLAKWNAENSKLATDYETLDAAEKVIGQGKLEDEKLLLLRDRERLQSCIFELQDLLLL